MRNFEYLNSLTPKVREQELLRVCGAPTWVQKVASSFPIASEKELLSAITEAFRSLSEKDWLEAFAAHPRIGDTPQPGSGSAPQWEEEEQKGTRDAQHQVLRELSQLNEEYFHKFGFIFIIYATGKSAAEMLACLKARLANNRVEEIRIAAKEQEKITFLRLEKLNE